MKYKKFIIIPILLVAYIYLAPFLIESNFMVSPAVTATSTSQQPSGGGQVVSFGEAVSVLVTRPYLFGLIRLPIYTNAVGDVSVYHEMFFAFIIVLTIAFVAIEIINWRKKPWRR